MMRPVVRHSSGIDYFEKLFSRFGESVRHCFAITLLTALLALQGSLFTQAGAKAVDWQTDVKSTISKTEPGKIIVLVQFDCDFLEPVLESAELKNFSRHSLDSTTRKWLGENAVMIGQAIGFPSQIKLSTGKKTDQEIGLNNQRSIGTCVIWLCDFKGTVCDFIVGLPDSKRCLIYTSPSPRDATLSRMPSSA